MQYIIDYSISCTSQYYKSGRAYAIFMFFVYPIGVPILYFCLLYSIRNIISESNKEKSFKSSHKITPFKFLFDSYTSEYWYWEVIETIRRLLLTGILVVGGIGTSLKLAISMVISMIFIKLYGSNGLIFIFFIFINNYSILI